jgi:regulator of sigma E protease
MSILFAIVGLALLVLVHEAGHFFTAMTTRMRPRRFYVGFPPAIAKVERNGVEYGLGAIPLGGYVKIPGMFRPGKSDPDLYFGRAAEEDEALAEPVRTLQSEIERGRLEEARSTLAEIEGGLDKAQLSVGASRLARRGADELEGALDQGAYWRQPAWKRIVVIAAGPVTNLLVAIFIFAALYMLSSYRVGFDRAANAKTGVATTRVTKVLPDTPAERVGLKKGDVVVAINGRRVNGTTIITRISGSGGRPITITVRRGGQLLTLGPVRPAKISGESLPAAVVSGAQLAFRITRDIVVNGIGRLFVGKGTKQVSGPVGIVKSSSDAYKLGFADYIWVVGLISLSLGVLNLLPLLPLDGGHIAFTLIERVRGKAVPREVYERVSFVGIALVMLLFVIGLSNDIGRVSG